MKIFNQKGISTAAILLIVVLAIIAGGLIWWGVSKNTDTNTNQNTDNQNLDTNNVVLKTYYNELHGYSVEYLNNWTVTDENDVVNFDNKETNQNIRISIKPKNENTSLFDYILSQTSKADVVEGKYQDPIEVTINGIKGFQVFGEYVGTFVDTYMLLSDKLVIIGGVYKNTEQLEAINQITNSLRL